MINFLKDYSYSIFKMFVNQLGMTMFGLMLSMATHQNTALHAAASIFSILFYMALLYTMTWDIGYDEKIRIDNHRMAFNPLKGFYMSLVANIPNMILATLAVIGYYGGGTVQGGPDWAVNLFGISKTVSYFLEGMYAVVFDQGTHFYFFAGAPWILFAIVAPALITCTLAYVAGVKAFRILPFGGPKESKE